MSKELSKEMEFFIYLIENYAYYKNKNAKEVIEELQKYNLVERVFDGYEFYHIERLENAYEDIDNLIKQAKINEQK